MTQPARWLAALAVVALGCEAEDEKTAGTDVGNPVVLALRAEPVDGVVLDGASARYTLAAATGQVRDVQLAVAGDVACADLGSLPGGTTCTDGPTLLVINGAVTADLVTGTLSPEAKVPAGDYTGVYLRSGARENARGLIIELTPEAGGRDLHVEVAAIARLSFAPVEGEDGVFLADPSRWLSAVDLMDCAGDQPGQGPLGITLNPNNGACAPSQGR